jgi:hypothetical protein
MNALRLLLIAVAMAAATTPARSTDLLGVQLHAYRVISLADGEEQLVDAGKASPGDVLEYRVVYTNFSSKVLRRVQGTLPVPTDLEYVDSNATPKAALASLDGQKFAPVPLQRTVRLPSRKVVVQIVPPREYRALRWDLGEIAAGASVTVRARMRVTETTS